MKIILDFSGGETCRNNKKTVKKMIDELDRVDTRKHEVIIKWQLFSKSPKPSKPKVLDKDIFDYAYNYAKKYGYMTTASIFDDKSLDFLMTYTIPFIKIACRPGLYHFIEKIGIEIIVSIELAGMERILNREYKGKDIKYLCCIPKYPANYFDYKLIFCDKLWNGISDHTTSLELFKEYESEIYEKHYKLNNSTGKDAGLWAATPEQLKEIL